MLTLAACSKDEVVQQNPNDAISFSVVTNKAVSRAANGYCNNHMPKNFSVWARVGAVNYFEGETYKQENEGATNTKYVISGDTRYWPESGTGVDFFAAKNYQVDPTWDPATGLKLENFTVINTVKGTDDDSNVKGSSTAQNDFIYAVLAGASKDANGYNATTPLNFHHGLSQIVFKLKNQNENIYVKATGVKVMNVKNTGTFTFPTASTAPNVEDTDHDNPYNGTASTGAWGTWALTTDLDSYTATFDVVEAKKQDAAYSLTYANSPSVEYNVNSMYLMPQSFSLAATSATNTKLWNGTDALKKDVGGSKVYDTDCGAYVILTCQIYNIANPNELDTKGGYVDGTDIALWGGTTAKDIAVALPSTAPLAWEQGKKYVYTFVFTAIGNGGTDPDTDKPVFTPIKLEVTVDDFVGETDKTLDMVDK